MHLFFRRVAAMAAAQAFCCLVLSVPAKAQTAPVSVPAASGGPLSAAMLGLKKDSAKMKPYKEVIPASARTSTGFFSVHKVDDKFFLEIPDSLLGRDLLVVNRIVKAAAGVPAASRVLFGGAFSYAGDEIGESVIRFEKLTNDKLFLRTISFEERSTDSSANGLYRNWQNNNVQPIQAAFPIKAINGDAHAEVIDVTEFVNSDNAVLDFPTALKPLLELGQVAADRCYIDHIQAFPLNIEIRTIKTYTAVPGSKEGSLPRTYELNSSMVLLPRAPMHGRMADTRVGYICSPYVDLDANPDAITKSSIIRRWRMEPKSEDRDKYLRGELVEPVRPIVIYIDPLTPKKWVPYLIQGINDWQAAFEKAGFKNAIIGKEAPVDDSTWSLEDARHSALVYKPSDIENANGPSVCDPRSGEILETHINWYHNVMELLYKWYFVQEGAVDPRARHARFDDSLMGQLIRFVSSHEIGHTLGLMHNFGASSTVPVDSLRSRRWVDVHGHTPSIMDYARFDYVAQPEDSIDENGLFPHIGDYDKWAIQWGYRYLPLMSLDVERDTLGGWIVRQQATGPQYYYGSQIDPLDPTNFRSLNPDPRAQNEDLGDDAMKAGMYGIRNLQRVEPHILEWTYQPHEGYELAGKMYHGVVEQYSLYMGHVLKNVGGVMVTPKTVDQPGAVFVYNSREKQQRAMAFLNAQLFHTPNWLIDEHLYGLASVGFGLVSSVQFKVLDGLLNASRIEGLIAEEAAVGTAKAYTVTDLLHDLRQGVFGELGGGEPITVYRRDLQNAYVERLCELVGPGAHQAGGLDDGLSLLKSHAKQMEEFTRLAAVRYTDPVTRAHLVDLGDRLHQALTPR